MCKPASFIVMKQGKSLKVFWSKTSDSHENIISEHQLRETNVRGEITLARVEISPENNDFRIPLEEWKFKTDQDLLPEWFDGKEPERAVRKELKKWIKEKVVLPDETRNEVSAGDYVIAIYGTVQYVGSGGIVQYVRPGGIVQDVESGGVVQDVGSGGTVQYVGSGGIVQYVRSGGIVQDVRSGGIVQDVRSGGIVVTYTPLPDCRLEKGGVIVDRSGKEVKCVVG